ncbi:EamA family transporter [Paenibacillus septentrionalis]|uniref:EamA family transporter n=1 Tax=Paenibacillus septentrionalis TaxID=429342 RepID=A0ABW1VAY2_9BACL
MWLLYALCAALAFGIRGSLYHWTSTLGLSRNIMLCGVFASGALINGIAAIITGAEWNTASLIGLQMGLFSFAASACMYQGFAVGKASLIAILSALPPVVVVLVAYMIWNEQLHAMQWLAFVVLVCGVLIIRYSNDLSWRNLQGAQWGILTMLFFAGNDLSTKWSTLEGASAFPTLTNMFVMGMTCFALLALLDERKTQQTVFVSSRKRTFGIGLAVGITNSVGMILMIKAFGLGMTGLVSAIVAMNVVVILLYTRFFAKVPFTRLELGGMGLAFVGVLLIHLFK